VAQVERCDAGGRQHLCQLEHAAHVFAVIGEVVPGQVQRLQLRVVFDAGRNDDARTNAQLLM